MRQNVSTQLTGTGCHHQRLHDALVGLGAGSFGGGSGQVVLERKQMLGLAGSCDVDVDADVAVEVVVVVPLYLPLYAVAAWVVAMTNAAVVTAGFGQLRPLALLMLWAGAT